MIEQRTIEWSRQRLGKITGSEIYVLTKRYKEAMPWIEVQDSIYNALEVENQRDSIFLDEMKADICYSKARVALALEHKDEAEQ